jgi:hypothetical protein
MDPVVDWIDFAIGAYVTLMFVVVIHCFDEIVRPPDGR